MVDLLGMDVLFFRGDHLCACVSCLQTSRWRDGPTYRPPGTGGYHHLSDDSFFPAPLFEHAHGAEGIAHPYIVPFHGGFPLASALCLVLGLVLCEHLPLFPLEL